MKKIKISKLCLFFFIFNVNIDLKFVKYLMNLKVLNYLKENNLINEEIYKKSIVQIEKFAQ